MVESSAVMIVPILYAALACLFWGFIFVAPLYLNQFSCFDIVLGRFLAFGAGALVCLIVQLTKEGGSKLLSHWKEAALCAFVINMCCFSALTLGMRLSNPSLVTLIIGLAPIAILFVESKSKKTFSLLWLPVCFIFLGIVLVNVETIRADWNAYSLPQYLLGLLLGLFSLASWCWYVIYNSRWLQNHPEIKPASWTCLMGSITLVFALGAAGMRWIWADSVYLERFALDQSGIRFVGTSLVLGLVSSLAAFTLWNRASARLPASLMGQLAILETVFSLVFINVFQEHFPTMVEFLGILLIVGAVWSGVYKYSEASKVEGA